MSDTERLTSDERALLEAQKRATPLPWHLEEEREGDETTMLAIRNDRGDYPVAYYDDIDEIINLREDLGYIVAAANAVPGLIEQIARLRGERDEATTNAQACAHGECLGCIDFLGWTRPETSAEDAVHTPTAKELRTRADRAEAERDALATIAAAQERALKGDGDGDTVLEGVLRDTGAERDALREMLRQVLGEGEGMLRAIQLQARARGLVGGSSMRPGVFDEAHVLLSSSPASEGPKCEKCGHSVVGPTCYDGLCLCASHAAAGRTPASEGETG